MNHIIRLFTKNRVLPNLLMFSIFVAGFLSLSRMKVEIFPETTLDMINITVPYPGAAPEEAEKAVCIRIEEAVQSVTGIKEITSTASEGAGMVTIEVMTGFDPDQVFTDVKTRVDAIDTFPEEAEEPVVEELVIRSDVISIAIHGKADEATLRALAERVRDDLNALDDISQVTIKGVRPYEISAEISEDTLRKYGLTLKDVADSIHDNSLDLPSGTLKTESGEILLRAKGQAYIGEEFESIPVLTAPDGTRITLGEIARVVDGFEEESLETRFDGERSAVLTVYRVGDQNALDVARTVKDYIQNARMPEGVELTVWKDDSRFLKDRLSLLIRNAITGLCLVYLLLTLFLRFSLAGWVTLGIPISFFGAFAVMPSLGLSINMISLFALILVLGVVVDDAIVVGENIYTQAQKGLSGVDAAVRGTQSIALPVIFAVLTSVSAFLPMLNIPGVNGKIWRVIPLTVIPTLIFSLVESLLILPQHLSHLKGGKTTPKPGLTGLWTRTRMHVADALQWFIQKIYKPVLHWTTLHRYATLGIFTSALLFILGMVSSGWVPWVFFPQVPADYVIGQVEMPLGTSFEVTSNAIGKMEQAAIRVQNRLEKEEGAPVIAHIMASAGSQPFKGHFEVKISSAQSHIGEVAVELTPADQREISSKRVEQLWREETGDIPGAVELKFSSKLRDVGEALNIQIRGENFDHLRQAADELKEKFREFAGTRDITDDFREGKKEIKMDIKPEAEILGLNLSDLARQVRHAFYGAEAQRIQRGRHEIKVMVRYPIEERRSIDNLHTLRIRTPEGKEVPFDDVAEAREGAGYSTIHRQNRQRAISVLSDVNTDVGNAEEIRSQLAETVLPKMREKYSDLRFTFEGEGKEQTETLGGLISGFVMAFFLIYALIAIPLNSYVQGFIIIIAIPFSLIGAIGGHMIMGMPISILSVCGITALAGVAVNDGLVLVHRINEARGEGMSVLQALLDAGPARFRPILLTSLTTFVGLLPLMLEKSLQAQFLIPMAVSLSFGVLFTTVVNLILVPAFYMILEDVKKLFGIREEEDAT